jgi:exopolysaccharide production protein ExoQ
MLKRFERYFAIAMLFYLSGSILGFLFPDSEFSMLRPESNTFLLAMELSFYAITFALIALRWNRFVQGLLAGKWALAVSGLAIVSTIWSNDPSMTARRSLVLMGTTLFGVYFGSNFDLGEQVRILAKVFGIIVVLSFYISLMMPQYGINHDIHGGSWTGVFTQKNLLGRAMIVAVVVFLSANKIIRTPMRYALLASAGYLLLMSDSRTSQVVLIAMLLLAPIYQLTRRNGMTIVIPISLAFGIVLVAIAVIAITNADSLLVVMGRNPTLTGRTEIWKAIWNAITKQMILGYGFNGFWEGIRGKSADVILTLGWVAKHSHNGFLDIWLDLGIVGLGVFLLSYFNALWRAVHMLRRRAGTGAYWPIHFLVFMLLYHLTEGPILRQNSIYWALYVAVVVSVHLAPSPAMELIIEQPLKGAELEPQPDYLPG